MRRTWREHVEALDEYRAAALWYEDKRATLGEAFMDAVDAAIDSILDPQVRWGFYRSERGTPQIYTRSVAGFPFDIIFLLIEGKCTSWRTPTKSAVQGIGRNGLTPEVPVRGGRWTRAR